jgi:peroxiredoxin Q/BCP
MSKLGKAWAVCLCGLAVGILARADEVEKPGLKVGDKAPAFKIADDQGNEWNSSDHVGKKIIVVYFYPADCTGGCTKQALGYRDDIKKLKAKGVEVVGVSCDSAKNHQVFKNFHKLSFTLLADEEAAVAKMFGVPLRKGVATDAKDEKGKPITDGDGKPIKLQRGFFASRWTFVIGKDGTIIYKDTKVDAAQDSKKILELVEKTDK